MEKEEKKVVCNEYALPKFRYMELRYFALQYSYWKYVVSKIDAGEWDMTKEIASHPGAYYKDPTSAKAIFRVSLVEKIALIDEAMRSVKNCPDEKKEMLLTSVTTEISWSALVKKGLEGVDQDEFYKARMEFFHNLDMLKG